MKAVVYDRYGPPDVLRIEEVERPLPKADEVLIKVHASTVTQSDTHLRAARPVFWRLLLGLRRPRRRILGVEFAGEVAEVGASVSEFVVGDRVFGTAWFGSHAEFLCLRERAPIARMPAGMTFDEAAAVCDGAIQALATLKAADVHAGQRIVIYGASGSLGTAAVQIAKERGAHVTAVCSTRHIELVRSLGADEVVDYTQEDFTRDGPMYDAIVDAVGKYAFYWGRRALKSGGVYVETDFGPHKLDTIVMAFATRLFRNKRLRFAAGNKNKPDVVRMKELIEAGKYRPVIDRRFPMDQVVEAHRYVEGWHKTGNVVLAIVEPEAVSASMGRPVGSTATNS